MRAIVTALEDIAAELRRNREHFDYAFIHNYAIEHPDNHAAKLIHRRIESRMVREVGRRSGVEGGS